MASPDNRALRPSSANGPGKAVTSSPRVTLEDVELSNVGGNGKDATPNVPLEDDIMQCARLGETGLIQKMFEIGKLKPTHRDKEGITPLHWAAINNQYATCKFLIDQGADVNAKGGESDATPAMWAAQRCHYYVVHLLLKSGADPLLVDGQGYNILHLATIDGNAFLVALLLHQEIPVDVLDPQQHTSLMWAAYKGFPACVDLLLRWGANVNAKDEKGMTPLHWSLVRGSQPCIQKIIEFGADRFAETDDGKDPTVVAQEMRSTRMWHRALAECGYGFNGHPRALPLGFSSFTRSEKFMSRFFFLWPFLGLFLLITILSHSVIYIGILICVAVAWMLQWSAQKLGQWGPGKFRNLHHTPYLAGWFAGTLFFVGARWVYWILPVTFTTNPFLNILFAASYGLTTFFYFTAFTGDPGYVPRLNSRNKEKETIDELFSLWKFDEDNFCIQCMVRKPLRSKHCRRCGRCIAKHDHHCPWINNCVAVNNHRHFFLYVLCMEIGIVVFVNLALSYIGLLPDHPPNSASGTCTILSTEPCSLYLRDPWTVILSVWISLQFVWSAMLLFVQLVQISRNQTTFENMRSRNSIDQLAPASQAITAALTAGTTSAAGAGLTNTGMGPDPSANAPTTTGAGTGTAAASRPKQTNFCSQWARLLGLDTFIATARGGLTTDPTTGQLRPQERPKNPFSRGVFTNCKDFWSDPSPVFSVKHGAEGMLDGQIVNYASMYEVPRRVRGGGRDGMRYTAVAGDEDPV